MRVEDKYLRYQKVLECKPNGELIYFVNRKI